MIKVWRFIVIPAAVFVVGIIIFFTLLNQQGIANSTEEMPEATLPVVYIVRDGERINALHGYTEEMEVSSMRDTITPVESDGTLTISIDTYGDRIESVSYEVRSLDASRLVQQSEAENLSVEEDVVTADLSIQDLLTEQTEYLLTLEVEGSGGTCHYYTRIFEDEGSNIDECISFVRKFHENTMNKARQSELADYMETKSGEDNSTLSFVTLRNSLSQVCWGSMRGTEETEPVISVKEIGSSYNVILLDYILSSTDEQENTYYYNVEEYYRVREGQERMYLLDFERTVEEIWRGQTGEPTSEDLDLGIRSSDVNYMVNEAGTVICFEQAGELWNYSISSGTVTKVFSFRSSDGFDVRENLDEHDIRIIRVSDTGSVDFIVYGYMNRGEHEGEVGISICHFDSVTATVEERAFLPCRKSYQVLRAEVGEAMYINDSGQFYFVTDSRVYCVDPDTGETSVEIPEMSEGNYVRSEDGRYLAWTEDNAKDAAVMQMIDLETGRTGSIEATDGFVIRPLGFLDSDCIYGLALKSSLPDDLSVFTMSRVEVIDFSDPNLAVLKTYESTGGYVTGAEVRDGNIYLERMVLEDGEYVETDEDVIYNREMQEASSVSVVETYSDIRETEVALRLPEEIPEEPEVIEPRWIRADNTAINLFDQINGKAYLVYAKGKVLLATDNLADAAAAAEEDAGVVIGDDMTLVWEPEASSE